MVDLAFLYLFVKQSDLLLRIGQRVVGDGEQFRVLADSFYILGGDLFPVANALLDDAGWTLNENGEAYQAGTDEVRCKMVDGKLVMDDGVVLEV